MIPLNKQIWPTAIWGVLQIFLLIFGAMGFPMWAHPPVPHESLTFLEVICGQVFFFGLLAPLFSTDAVGLLIAIVLLLPIDELAGLLSNISQIIIFKGFACAGLWMIGVGGLALMLIRSRSLPMVSLAATLFTAGGAVLDYLRAESAVGAMQLSPWSPASPMLNLCLINKQQSTLLWIEMSIPAIALLIGGIMIKLNPNPRG